MLLLTKQVFRSSIIYWFHGFMWSSAISCILSATALSILDVVQKEACFTSLLLKGYSCDEIAWKILIDTLLEKGRLDLCSDCLTMMEEMKCFPSPEIYTALAKKHSYVINGLPNDWHWLEDIYISKLHTFILDQFKCTEQFEDYFSNVSSVGAFGTDFDLSRSRQRLVLLHFFSKILQSSSFVCVDCSYF